MSDLPMFIEAKEAIENGELVYARELLTKLLRTDKENPEYWLWMSAVVSSKKEKIFCLKKVIHFDPENCQAKHGLILLGGIKAENVQSASIKVRNWKIDLEQEGLTGWKRLLQNPVLKIGIYLFSSIIILGLLWGGVFGTRGIGKPRLTITPIPWTNTPTLTITKTPIATEMKAVLTPTPQPLWMLLDATFTPTPLYINTPHPRVEAYRLAIRAYDDGDYQGMINFLEQTLRDEPGSVDILYYLGEGYMNLGDYDMAFQFYEDALLENPQFAPAFLSRARLRRMINPKVDILDDLNSAINFDPKFREAYHERGLYWFEKLNYDSALADLENAISLSSYDSSVVLDMARVYLAIGDYKNALDRAEQAHRLDITFLDTYLVLAKAYLENNMLEDALSVLDTYGLYSPEDPLYLALKAGILYKLNRDYQSALILLENAKELDRNIAEVYYYHGLISNELGDTKQAVNDLYVARDLMPEKIEYSLWFGIMLYEDERFSEAYTSFKLINPLEVKDDQLGRYYYYLAKSAMALSLIEPVQTALLALYELHPGLVQDEWIKEVEEYLSPEVEEANPIQTISPTSTVLATMNQIETLTVSASCTPTPSP